jgi:hypothetical protein
MTLLNAKASVKDMQTGWLVVMKYESRASISFGSDAIGVRCWIGGLYLEALIVMKPQGTGVLCIYQMNAKGSQKRQKELERGGQAFYSRSGGRSREVRAREGR